MPTTNVNLLAKEVLRAVVSEVESAFSDEGYADVDRRVWAGDVPDDALDPWCIIEVVDDIHSDYEDKDSPVEVVFMGVSLFATEDGATNPYVAALDLAKRTTQRMTDETFSVSGLTVFENRLGLTEPASQTGPEKVNLYGFTNQFEIHVE